MNGASVCAELFTALIGEAQVRCSGATHISRPTATVLHSQSTRTLYRPYIRHHGISIAHPQIINPTLLLVGHSSAMSVDQSLLSAQSFIEAMHRGSVICAAFGLDVAVKHAVDHALCMWTVERGTPSASWTNFDDFVRASYHDLSESDQRPHNLAFNSIPFFAWGTFAFDAYTFQARSASWWYMLDVVAPKPSHIIPSTPFIPYAKFSPVRSLSVAQGFKRTPLWFIRCDGGLGIAVQGSRSLLWHGEKDFRRCDGTWKTTMKIKFSVRALLRYFLPVALNAPPTVAWLCRWLGEADTFRE